MTNIGDDSPTSQPTASGSAIDEDVLEGNVYYFNYYDESDYGLTKGCYRFEVNE